jgi:hypothetical protein
MKYVLLLSFLSAGAFAQLGAKFGSVSIEEANLKICEDQSRH